MDIKQTLEQLTQARGPSGGENEAAQVAARLMQPLCQDVSIDAMGNVIGIKRGSGPEPRPRVMLMAHLDEIHLTVSAIDGEFLRFVPHGFDPRILVGVEVIVLGQTPLPGVIGDLPPHLLSQEDRKRMPEVRDLAIDLGLPADQVAELVRVGDQVVLDGPFQSLLGDRVASKSLDDRLMVATMLATLEALQRMEHPCDVIAVASVQEEFSGLGARTATWAQRPDLAIALDVSFARQPGMPEEETFPLGSGPAIALGPNLHPHITRKLLDLAEALEIPHEVDVQPGRTGTDAWDIQVSAGGIPTGLVGISIRNMHTPAEVADLKDVGRTARLLAAFLAQADAGFIDSLAYRLPDTPEVTA